jgi:hypothetical protein
MADEITNVSAPEAAPVEEVLAEAAEAQADNSATVDEVARLKTELARYKAAVDKATKEASESKKALRARQTAEEIAAEEKRAADEARDNELADLRKRFAVAEIGKKAMTLGGDVEASGRIAEMLFGAEDPEGVLNEVGKLFSAREKALRLEFGRIPAPGVGADSSPEALAVNRARDIGKARAEADKQANEALKAYMR